MAWLVSLVSLAGPVERPELMGLLNQSRGRGQERAGLPVSAQLPPEAGPSLGEWSLAPQGTAGLGALVRPGEGDQLEARG